jgi:hypothetical protein
MTTEPDVAKPKRLVSYNKDAVLCPACKKRIRLNNNGRLRVHIAGKVGSDKCMGSNAEPLTHPVNLSSVSNQVESDPKTLPLVFQKSESGTDLFSDPQ